MIFETICLISIVLSYFYWINRKLYKINGKFRRELVLPFFGNTYIFICKDEDILNKLGCFVKRGYGNNDYYKPKVFWFCSKMFLLFTDMNQIEKILISQKFAYKSVYYDFVKIHLGEGLVTASGPNFVRHKKAITPLFGSNFNKECYEIFEKYLDECTEDMKEYCTGNTFNIGDGVLRDCFLRFIGHAILGIKYDPEKDHQFAEDAENFYKLPFWRITRPWLHFDLMYKMTSVYRNEQLLLSRTTAFIKEAVENSSRRIKSEGITANEMEPIIDQLARILQENPDLMSDKEFRDHMYTLFLASEDTLIMTVSFCCLMLGMYPECQEKVGEELRNYFGTIPRNATLEDIGHLPYLDMCIKETLRIQLIAPILPRRAVQECKIDDLTIPKDTQIVIPVFYIHRDPKFWENPEHFHPDHFLPDKVRERPVYAYMPFSAGPRGCIGRLLANTYTRIFLATFLQKFELEADGKLPDIKFKMDISARPVQGYHVKIKERIWN